MASFVFTNAKRAILAGEIDFANDDIRIILVDDDTTLDGGEEDISTFGAASDASFFGGSGHDTTNGHALDSQAVAADNTNDRGEFDAADEVLSSIGANPGGANAIAVVVFKWVTNIGSSIPIAFIDSGGFPFDGNGGDITFTWNAEGIIQAT